MNKLFTKIAALALGMTMATGVGVAVASSESKTNLANAASEELAFHFRGSSLATGTTYQAWSGSVSSSSTSKVSTATWQITVGNNSAQLGTNAKSGNLSKTTLGNGNFSAASGVASALSITTTTQKYAAVYCTTGMANITKGELIFTGTNGGNITTAWLLSSTNGTSWTIESTKTSSITSGSTFNVTKSSTAKQFAFVCYWNLTNAGGLKGFEYKLYGEYDQTQTITVDPASKEAYTDESISLTTNAASANWALSNNTCGASLSAASGKNVSVSATSAGSVRVTATASGYTSPYVDLTFNEKPSSPYITPAKNSTSGYTGQNESISFSYGNLTSSLSVVSSNTSVVTVGTPSLDGGEGSVQFNFVGAGSTTVKFKDGSTECASVSVTVTASTVTISGMPSAKSVGNGSTLNLGALITITPTGSCSSDVTWSTSNSNIASVTQAGVVTGAAVGTATITVTPDDYQAGAVSCTVTVANVFTAVFGTERSAGTNEITDANAYKTDYNYTIDSNITLSNISKAYPQDGKALKFSNSSTIGSMTFSIPSTIDSKSIYITNVTVRAERHHETNGTTLSVGGIEEALAYTADDYTFDLSSGEVTSFVLTAASSSSDKRFYIHSVTIEYAFKKTLSNIVLSGTYPTSFTKDDTFSHSGMVVTANYSDSSSAVVTNGATWSSPDMSTTGNKTITVSYSDAFGSASTTYSITVNYAAVTSVTLSQNSAEIGLQESFNYNEVVVTVNPSTANPAVTWSVSANTVGDDYTFNSSGLISGNTEGTITLKCESDADSTKYATIVVTVSGEPTASFAKESTSGFAGKNEIISFTYGNFDAEDIVIASGNTSYVTIGTVSASEGSGTVVINFVGAGSTSVTIGDGNSTLDTLTVTVSADSVVSVTWSASNINVYSGATLSTTGWNVQYEMASGDHGSAVSYTIKLGSATVTAGYTFQASDDGKTMHVEYGGVSSSSITVAVTQSLRPVMADVPGVETTKTWTAVAASDFGTTISSVDGTDTGTLTFDDSSTMSYERTLEFVASGKADYLALSDGYIQFGSSNALEKLELTATTTGTVTTISVDCWSKNGAATISATVGGNAFGTSQSTPSAKNSSPISFTGSASGTVVIKMEKSTKTAGLAQYIKSVSITTVESSGEKVNIANVAGHEAAQKAVVKFAKAFNAAMDTTSYCTTNMSSAWSTASSAWNTFLSEAAALGETEEAYAKNLVKYATAQWTEGTDSNYEYCLERALATYEKCVNDHGQTAFMDAVRPLERTTNVNPISLIGTTSSNTVAIVVIVSLVSVTAVAGYFFLRRRKEN